MTDVIRFAALWCPDFPTSRKTGNQQADFLAGAKVSKFCGKKGKEERKGEIMKGAKMAKIAEKAKKAEKADWVNILC